MNKEFRPIRGHVVELFAKFLRGERDEIKFVHELEDLTLRAVRALNGEYKPPVERDLDDGKASFGRFVSDQRVVDFTTAKGILCEKLHKWWWPTEQKRGEVRDLPGLAGYARITDGVMLWIEDDTGSVHFVHKDNFKYYRVDSGVSPGTSSKKKTSKLAKGGLSREVFQGLLE